MAFPDFAPDQTRCLRALASAHPALAARLSGWTPAGGPRPLLSPEELEDLDGALARVGAAPVPTREMPRLLPQESAPFLAFVTRDVSVRREILQDTGGFWEAFTRYGLADWEYGYRLYRHGARFACSPAAACVHQEHPAGGNRHLDNAANYALFLERHPEPDVALMACAPPWMDQERYARLCAAYHRVGAQAEALRAALDPLLLGQARAWAAWGASPRGLPPTPQAGPRALPTVAATLQLWHALRDPDAAELLRSAGITP